MNTSGATRATARPRGFERRPARRTRRPAQPSGLRPTTGAAPGRRLRVMRVLAMVCFAGLGIRLVVVQAFSGGRYSTMAAQEVTSSVQVPAPRGTIYDRNGQVLAVSVPTDTVVGDPELISHPAQEAVELARALGSSVSTLDAELSEHSGYVVLATQVGDSKANQVRGLDLAGINLLPTTRRADPAGALAGSVLGSVDAAGAGDSGLEYGENRLLAGRAGTVTEQRTPDDVPLPGGGSGSSAVPGTGLELTLDEPLQYVTEQSLGAEVLSSHAKSGIAVVMDSRTGEILAMANLMVDPGTGKVTEAPSNFAVTKVYEPGSVFKLVTFSAALQNGLIEPQERFTVPSSLTIDGWVFHDAEQHPIEQLTATQILAQSSNLGTIEIAGLVGPDRLASQIAALGFGRTTGLDFPGESAGLVNLNPDTWSGSAMGSTPIGQNDAVTAQQVLDMVNTVATGGTFVPPRLVRALVEPDGTVRRLAAPATHQVLSAAVSSTLTTMMEQVVQDGTAVAAGIPGYTVAGKTGTAQVPDPVHGGYIPGAYMATFAGFAPAQDPVLSAVVVLEQPTPIYGGTVAAPVFAQVMNYALHRYGIPSSDSAGAGAGGGAQAPSAASSPSGEPTTATINTAGNATGTP